MKITKVANLESNTVTFTVELERPDDYKGIDVYPDDRLAEILLAISRMMSKRANFRKVLSNGLSTSKGIKRSGY